MRCVDLQHLFLVFVRFIFREAPEMALTATEMQRGVSVPLVGLDYQPARWKPVGAACDLLCASVAGPVKEALHHLGVGYGTFLFLSTALAASTMAGLVDFSMMTRRLSSVKVLRLVSRPEITVRV